MTTPLVTRILLADDHNVVRVGLRMVLELEADLTVVAEVGDGDAAVRRASETDIDLAILDISMPRMTGLQAARALSAGREDLRILLLSMHDNEQYLFEALAAGASGYVLKSAADRDLVAACRSAMRGVPFIYPDALSTIFRHHLRHPDADESVAHDPLTPRETEVVKLVAEEHSTASIAELLVISPKTVERHRANILEKLGLRDRVALTRYAIRRGLSDA